MVFTTFGGFACRLAHSPNADGRMTDDRAVRLAVPRTVAGVPRRRSEDWPSAGASLNRIRQIIAVNLPLGLLVVVIGASGRYWG